MKMEGINTSLLSDEGQTSESADVSPDPVLAYKVSVALWHYAPPIIIVLGTFGHVMTIVLCWEAKSRKSAVSTYFAAIAVADLANLLLSAFPEWINMTFGISVKKCHRALCKVSRLIDTLTGTISNWFLVSWTIQRTISVIWPHRVNMLCTQRRIKATLAGVVVFFTAYYAQYLYGFDLKAVNNGTEYDCVLTHVAYTAFHNNVFSYMELLIYSLIPFLIHVVGNSLMAWKLIKSAREAAQNLTTTGSRQVSSRVKDGQSVNLTVMLTSLTFLILTFPNCVHFIMYKYTEFFNIETDEEQAKMYLFYTISMLMAAANQAVNFYLYMLTGATFRRKFFDVISCKLRYKHENKEQTSLAVITNRYN